MTTTNDYMTALATAPFTVGAERPWLLFDRAQVDMIRARAHARPELLETILLD